MFNTQNQKPEVESIDWDFPEIGDQNQENKKRIKLFAEDIYFVQCVDYKITKSPRPNQYTGQFDINCTWQFKIIKSLSGEPLKYSNGEEARFDTFPVWTNVTNMGTSKDGTAQDTRAIMTALMGIPSHAAIGKPDANNFINKFARVVCKIGTKKTDGSPKQVWSAWAPWNGKELGVAQTAPQIVEPVVSQEPQVQEAPVQ